MRLDKFLQISRLIKRRTWAKKACNQGRIQLNDRVAKAGAEVCVGDRLRLDLGRRHLYVEVLSVAEKPGARNEAPLYLLLEERLEEENSY